MRKTERKKMMEGIFILDVKVACMVVMTALGGCEWKTERKKNSRKSVTWSAVPDASKLVYVGMRL